MNPSQPLTAAPWMGDWVDPTRLSPMTAYMLDSSDVITFHSYDDSATVERLVTALERYGRPIICSEYMWYRDYKGEPDVWFHDIFTGDGRPYAASEVAFIRSMTAANVRR
jgi:hypothetical protein